MFNSFVTVFIIHLQSHEVFLFNKFDYFFAVVSWIFIPEITHVTHQTNVNGQELKSENEPEKDHTNSLAKKKSISVLDFVTLFDKDLWGHLVDVFLMLFLMSLAIIMYRSNYSILLREKYNTSHKTIGYITSLTTIVGVLASYTVGKIVKMYKEDLPRLYLHSSILLAICLVALAYSPNLYVLMFFLALMSVASAVARVCCRQIAMSRCHPDEIGVVTGMMATVTSVSRMMAPLLGGIAMDMSREGPELLGIVIVTFAVGYMVKNPPKYDHEEAVSIEKERLTKKLE